MKKSLLLEKPLVAFDLETTGTDAARDRIVSIAAFRFTDELVLEKASKHQSLVNPGIPIPPIATDTHGITDEMVRQSPTFKKIAAKVHAVFDGADLLGYNIRNFDVPLLWEEFHRAGVMWNMDGARIIDPCVIFKAKEPRDLATALKKYDGADHTDAHDAAADALAAVAILVGQRWHYEDIGKMSLDELAAFSCEEKFDGGPARRLDLAGNIIEVDGVARYTARKVRGVPVRDDPGFGNWMLRNDFPENTKAVLRELLQ